MPDPETLARYGEIVPDAPDRIIRMAEAATSERASMESRLVDGEIESTKQGISMAFVLALICALAAIGLFAVHNEIGGGVMLGLPAMTMIGTFITRSSRKDD